MPVQRPDAGGNVYVKEGVLHLRVVPVGTAAIEKMSIAVGYGHSTLDTTPFCPPSSSFISIDVCAGVIGKYFQNIRFNKS